MIAPVRGVNQGVLLIFTAALLFSTGGLFIKIAPLPALAVVAGRALVTSTFFIIAFRPRLALARWSTGLVYAAMIFTFVVATKLTTAANAIFLQYTAPIYVAMLAPRLLGERARPRDTMFLALCFVGMGLVFAGDMRGGRQAGNVIAMISGVFFALTIIFLRRDAREPDGHHIVTASTTLGNLLALSAALPFVLAGDEVVLTGKAILVLLYLGVVQVGFAYVLMNRGLSQVGAATAALTSMVEPVMNPVWVFLGTGERPGPLALVGGAVVLCIVAIRALVRS